jgi:hypothetical protein
MDNFYVECPANMSDGRIFTDYRTSSRREQFNKTINGIVREDEYRAFLQSNGDKILDRIWESNKQKNSCHPNPCVHRSPTRTTPSNLYNEMQLYNQVYYYKNPQSIEMAKCANLADYRAHQL